jgi:hypothetical protein
MFEKFPSLTRFSHGWTITEKLDGTNAAVNITPVAAYHANDIEKIGAVAIVNDFFVFAQSRTKLITPGKSTDNHGFAQFVKDNAENFVRSLGEGRHFGEWVGPGIGKRHYNLKEKQFALFNVYRWSQANLPARVTTVPCMILSQYLDDPGHTALYEMEKLRFDGSMFGPKNDKCKGFENPEGVVMYHGPSQTSFKKTFDYDEQGKWADKCIV